MYKDEAFYTGESFHRVGLDIVPNDGLDNDTDDGHWFIPSIVNLAFACELYIKSLISQGENVPPKIHRWNDLFKKRPDLADKLKNAPEFKGDEELDNKIEEGGKVFVDWRYICEHDRTKSVDIVFLENFAQVLHNLAKDEVEKFLNADIK